MKFIQLLFLLSIFSSSLVFSQDITEEEVVVTGFRDLDAGFPGVTYTRKGDFLLLKILVSSDTRDSKKRQEEIYSTLNKAIKLASMDPNIEVSTIQNGFVVPLSENNYQVDLNEGNRPDTSEIIVRVKTTIGENVKNPTTLVAKMEKFAKSIPVVGRVEITTLDDIDVSVVNPSQYRNKILKLISQDVKNVTSGLGEDYRVVLEGVDGPIQWVKSGSISLTMYINYRYTVVPKTINSIFIQEY